MVRKLRVKWLTQDELTYELTYRGIGTGTVDEMRKSLSQAQRLEQEGSSLSYPDYPFSHAQDVEAVRKKLSELEVEIGTFSGSKTGNPYLRLQSKLHHVLNRVENTVATGAEETKTRADLLARTLAAMETLSVKAEDVESKQVTEVVLLEGSPTRGQPSFDADLSGAGRTSSVAQDVGSGPLAAGVKPILPHKWGISFSGDKKGMSITAFLERVEELRKARGVSKSLLLDSGIDLFTGRAFQFYQDVRHEVSTWEELSQMFKDEYQPVDYNERLFEEIKRRTQGPEETIGTYLAVMSKYFQRLECPITEKAKLKILLRNILPYYQSHLGLVDIESIAQLRDLCRRLEERRHTAANFSSPIRPKNSLEPDLAYVQCDEEPLDVVQTSSQETSGRDPKDVVCYRCNQKGHRAIGCASNSSKVCFKCGKVGYTVRTCPDCSRSSGNGRRRSQGAESRA